jgi:hypothetical protein
MDWRCGSSGKGLLCNCEALSSNPSLPPPVFSPEKKSKVKLFTSTKVATQMKLNLVLKYLL